MNLELLTLILKTQNMGMQVRLQQHTNNGELYELISREGWQVLTGTKLECFWGILRYANKS